MRIIGHLENIENKIENSINNFEKIENILW